ncbi:MAG: excinuclease ABC subunit UvrC [Rhodoluna sp.]
MATYLSFKPKPSEIPIEPGVYRWFDQNGRVLYVGKAKNLRSRLSSYFAPIESLPERTRRMVQLAVDVQWTIVRSEFEALQLEFTWIKEFNPPYNVQFRDDKSYPYLAISINEDYPRVFVTRNRELKGLKYFGPYTQVWAVRETLDALLKVYQIRSCTKGVFENAKRNNRPCLLGDIGKCSAPCVGRTTQTEHLASAKQFIDFMSGSDISYIKNLRQRMMDASKREQYELAGRLRDDIDALETVLEKSTVVFTDDTDADVFGIADEELAAAVTMFRVRGGRIRGSQGWVIDKELERDGKELIEYVLQNVYDPTDPTLALDVPKEVLIPYEPDEVLSKWLESIRGSKVELRVAKRGDKATLCETATTNAKHSLALYKTRRVSDFTSRADALSALQKDLDLESAPLRIECFDISHLSGTDIVGSMVVFEDGLPKKSQYRKFAIENSADDTDSIYQVLTRRLNYLKNVEPTEEANKFSYRPSLIIVDGGAPQVNAAQRAINDSGVSGLTVIGLAKRLEEIWLPYQDFPLVLPRATDQMFLLQKMRDEAHRFAISYQRSKRSKTISSSLLDIPGLGEKRASALLKRFGSLKRLSAASQAEIAETAGIGLVLAQEILTRLSMK